MIHIQNPYPRSIVETGMIHANVPAEVYAYLRSVFPGHGNVQAVTNTLINHLVIALQSHGIERYDLENEQLILSVLTGRYADNSHDRKTLPRHERGGTHSVHKRASRGKNKLHSAGKPHRKGTHATSDPKTVIEDHS